MFVLSVFVQVYLDLFCLDPFVLLYLDLFCLDLVPFVLFPSSLLLVVVASSVSVLLASSLLLVVLLASSLLLVASFLLPKGRARARCRRGQMAKEPILTLRTLQLQEGVRACCGSVCQVRSGISIMP